MSRNPISKPEPIEIYDEEYVINCIIPLLEFINNYSSIADKTDTEARTDQTEKCEQKFNQSVPSKEKEPKSKANKTNKRSSLLPQLDTVNQNTINSLQTNSETTMDIRRIEQIEITGFIGRNLAINKPLERTSKTWRIQNIQWSLEKVQSAKTSQSGNKTNRNEFKPKKKKGEKDCSGTGWKKDKEPEEDSTRRKVLNRVIEKIRNMPEKQKSEQPGTSDNT